MIGASQDLPSLKEPTSPVASRSSLSRFQAPPVSFDFLVLVLYFAGIGFLVVRTGLRARALSRLLEQAPRLRTLGRLTIVSLSEIKTPFSFRSLRRSYVAIPETMLDRPRDLRVALAHEIEHIRARHTRDAILGEFLGNLFAPAGPLWKSVFTELHELSCDENVIGRARISSHEYASCLVRVAEAALEEGATRAGTACMATDFGNPKRLKSFLRRRMEMLTEYGLPKTSPLPLRALGTAAILFSVTLAFSAGAMLKPSELPPVNAGAVGVDPVFQKIATSQLQLAMDNYQALAGLAIIANPKTGEILASSSIRSKAYAKLRPDEWNAASRLIEPASTMKGIVLAAALEQGDLKVDDSIDCSQGSYSIGGKIHHDWKKFGRLSAGDVVVHSSNIGGIRIGERMGGARLEKALENFGFGAGSSVRNFPGARPGSLSPKIDDPEWLASVSTGFAVYVNPLELVQAYSAIANGGRLLKPIAPGTGGEPQEIRRVLTEENARKMREVLGRAVREGTGERSQSLFYSTGGKTGTNYHPNLKEHDRVFGGDESVAHFIGFAPLGDPQVTVYVAIIMPPKDANVHGNSHAGPVFKEIIERSLVQLRVKPDGIASK
jgi:hypothetical protein